MIIELVFETLFAIANWAFGYLPANLELVLAEKTTDIFGYGVWVLGDTVFTAISVIGMSEIAAMVTWSVVIFVWRLIRG